MSQTTTTPLSNIRTDVVGSLLRPAHLKQAYAQRDEGKISEEELHRIEDDAIRDAVRLQESLGLDVITDGEYRRLNFQDSFAASVSGFAARHVDLSFMESLSREGQAAATLGPLSRGGWRRDFATPTGIAKLRLTRNLPLEEYRFVSAVAQKPREGDVGWSRSDYAALRLSKFQIGLLEHGRFCRRRRAHRARDDSQLDRRRLPLRSNRRAELYGVCRRSIAG